MKTLLFATSLLVILVGIQGDPPPPGPPIDTSRDTLRPDLRDLVDKMAETSMKAGQNLKLTMDILMVKPKMTQ